MGCWGRGDHGEHIRLPGVGRLAIDAISNRDYPMIQGAVILVAASFVFVNLIVDIIYAFVDPRIRYA